MTSEHGDLGLCKVSRLNIVFAEQSASENGTCSMLISRKTGSRPQVHRMLAGLGEHDGFGGMCSNQRTQRPVSVRVDSCDSISNIRGKMYIPQLEQNATNFNMQCK